MADKTTRLTFAAKTTGSAEVQKLSKTIGELGKIDTFRKLNAEAKEAIKAWKEAEGEVKRLAGGMQSVERPTAAMRREFEKAKKAAAQLKAEYGGIKGRIAGLRKSMQGSGIDTKNLAAEQKRLQSALKSVRREAGQSMKLDAARGLLDIRPHKKIRHEIKEVRLAYERLRKSGTLSSRELAQAQNRLKTRIRELKAETKGWGGSVGKVHGRLIAMAAAGYGALRSFSATTNVVKDAETATFNMEKSVEAANREFKNTGSIEFWEAAVKRLSGHLKVYSETEIKNSASRVIDMTKRLGLNAEQMEEVIKRAGDLGAGQMDLLDAVERVTAALRAEAEAAERLGLTMSEAYTKAWYEDRGATLGAWKDLKEHQKTILRYLAFQEQSGASLGRAAASANTYSGALRLVRISMEEAIVNNPEVIDALHSLSKVLIDNADSIGKLVGSLVEGVAKLIKFAVEHKTLTKIMAGGLGALAAWKLGIGDMVKGSVSLAGHLRKVSVGAGVLNGAMAGSAASSAALALALKGGLVIGAAAAGYALGKLIRKALGLKTATEEAREAADALASQKLFVSEQAAPALDEINERLGLAVKTMDELFALEKQGKVFFDEVAGQWEKVAEIEDVRMVPVLFDKAKAMDSLRSIMDSVKALKAPTIDVREATGQFEAIRKQVALLQMEMQKARSLNIDTSAFEGAIKNVNALLNDISTDEIKNKIDELSRAAGDWYQVEGGEKQLLYPNAKEQIEALKAEMGSAKQAAEGLAAAMEIELPQEKTVETKAKVDGMDDVRRLGEEIGKLRDKTVTVTTVHKSVAEMAAGGLAGGAFKRIQGLVKWGGGLKDDVNARLKRLEFVMPPEATKKYGLEWMEAMRNLTFPVPEFAGGGLVGGHAPNLGTLNLNVGSTTVQGYFKPDVVGEIKAALRRETRGRRNY